VTGVARKLIRLREAADLVLRHAVGWRSKRHLLACYGDLGGALADATEFDVRLRCGAVVVPCRMRRSDVFTLAEIFHERQYETRAALPEAPVIFDAGANIGLASLWLAGRFGRAVIHAFEPEGDNFRLLERNLPAEAGHRCVDAALGAADGEAVLALSPHGATHSVTSGPANEARDAGTVPVKSMRLDTYLERNGVPRIDLLKLDVEGAELDVLEGLGSRIADVDAIVGEVHERAVKAEDFYDFLRAAGFGVRRREFRDGDVEGVHGFEALRA
jgi:FkbM family methyltransferase